MKKQYLDYAGLKRVLKHLLPGARKIWHGTLDEWKALSEAERDKYDQAEVIDGSGYQSDGVRNLHDPDWVNAVLLDPVGLYMDGYTAPSNGMIIGWFKFDNHITVLDLKVNTITVARAPMPPKGQYSSEGSVQCPVNKGDYIKLKSSEGSIGSDDIDAALYFVPYKAQ